jgi:histone demethylase JARID1
MAYIERVANETREAEFGICKIVPPKGWQPPFALDTEVSCVRAPVRGNLTHHG